MKKNKSAMIIALAAIALAAILPALAAVPDVPREDPPHAESSMVHAMEAAITLTKLRLIMFLL